MSEVHNLKAESIESRFEVSTPNLSEIIEKIKLYDKASKDEQDQMIRWFEEHFEGWQSTKDTTDIIEIAKSNLSEILSSDTLQFLIDLLLK